MTTVVLTPTHIASDHCKVILNNFRETVVDLQHKKIFIHPDNKFILATQGTFDPDKIQDSTTMESIRLACQKLRKLYKGSPLKCTEDSVIETLVSICEVETRFYLIMKDLRLSLIIKPKYISVGPCADYCGLGSGGNMATGMLLGGMSIFDIWDKLSSMNSVTSKQHTVISLDILEDFES